MYTHLYNKTYCYFYAFRKQLENHVYIAIAYNSSIIYICVCIEPRI